MLGDPSLALRTGETVLRQPHGLAQTSSWDFRGSGGDPGEGVQVRLFGDSGFLSGWNRESRVGRPAGDGGGGAGLGLVQQGNRGKHKLMGCGRREEGTGRALRGIQEIDDHGTGVSREREGEQI